MKLTIFTPILLLTSFTSALLIPENQPDGVYEASIDTSGNLLPGTTIHALQTFDRRSLPLTPDVTPNHLTARQLPNPVTRCNNRWLNASDYQCVMRSVDAFGNNQDIPSMTARWWTCGTAVIYMCNYSSQGNPVRGSEFRTVNSLLNANCGSVKSGWVIIDAWNKDYGREVTGRTICRMGVPI